MIPSVSTTTFTRTPTAKRSRFPPVHVLSALLFLILVKAPKFCDAQDYTILGAQFEASEYALDMIDQYDEAKQELAVIGILGTLIDNNIINRSIEIPSGVSLLFMYSFVWNEPFEPLPDCTDQSFGFEGQWTDTICNTIETLREACDAQESSCDPEAFQTVVAGTGDVIQASADRFASLLCLGSTIPQLELTDDNIATCTNQDVIDSLQPNIAYLQNLVNIYVPGGFDNIVFTKNFMEVATRYFQVGDDCDTAVAELSDPDSNLV